MHLLIKYFTSLFAKFVACAREKNQLTWIFKGRPSFKALASSTLEWARVSFLKIFFFFFKRIVQLPLRAAASLSLVQCEMRVENITVCCCCCRRTWCALASLGMKEAGPTCRMTRFFSVKAHISSFTTHVFWQFFYSFFFTILHNFSTIFCTIFWKIFPQIFPQFFPQFYLWGRVQTTWTEFGQFWKFESCYH